MSRPDRDQRCAARRRAARHGRDSGLASIELVILLPAFVLLVLLAAYLGRTNLAQASLDGAAQDAARAASLQRNQPDADQAAQDAADGTLAAHGSPCEPSTVTATITNAADKPFDTPLGMPSRVDVRVSCTVYVADLVFPGFPVHGDITMWSTFASPIDEYRVRTEPTPSAP